MLTEHQEEIVFAQWLDIHHIRHSKIAQDTFTKSWGTKARNRAEGVHMGVPDRIICAPKSLLFVEMKREKGGKTSPEQKEWIEALNALGVPSIIAKGAQEAIEFVQKYL